jgi:hypothetical protein
MTTLTAEPINWSISQKIAFRFFAIFFFLYIFFNPNGVIPGFYGIYSFYIGFFHKLMVWIARHILHLAKPITVFTNGSGDTTYDYLIILFMAVVAAASTIVWSVIDRRERNYNKLFYWVTVIVRFYIAITMVAYGSFKIIKLQFPYPSPVRLLEPVGNMSPMGLAWTYVGYSTGFNYFTGFAELACGLLLFFRRTTIAGALLGVVVAGNIMAINYCYDVPVKLLSTTLVAMCIFLLAKDTRRLINFFFLNRAALPANLSPHRFNKKWKNITAATIKYLLIAYVVTGTFDDAIETAKGYGDKAKKPPFFGIYNVQTFVRGHDTLPPLTTDTTRWSKLIISNGGAATKLMNDSVKLYNFKVDTVKHTFTMNTYADTLHKFKLTYSSIKPGIILLKGVWKKDTVQIWLTNYDLNNFLLNRRGFHWINEHPFNK